MEKDSILAFDTLFSFPQTQMLKLALPYLSAEFKPIFSIYIKFMELKQTIFMAHKLTNFPRDASESSQKDNPYESICSFMENITPYVSKKEQEQFDRIKNLLQSMQQFQDMKPMLDMILNMQNTDSEQSTEHILKNFLNEEQMNMFQFFMDQKEGEE